MKWRVKRNSLLNAVQIVQQGVDLYIPNPILRNVLFEMEDKERLILISISPELSIRTEIKVDCEENGSVLVPVKRFSEILRGLEGEEVSFFVDEKNRIEISTKNSIFILNGLPKRDFPLFIDIPKDKGITIPSSVFVDVIKKTLFAVALDDIRVVLNGVYFLFDGDFIEVVATDSYRLALIKKRLSNTTKKEEEVIIPPKILERCLHIFKGGEILDILIKDNSVVIRDMDTILVSKVIEGQYIDYKRLIPKGYKKKIDVRRKVLLDACYRISIMTSDRNDTIKIALKEDSLFLYTSSPDIGEAKEKIDVFYRDEEIEMGFNLRYLIDAIKNMDDDIITLSFSTDQRPLLIESSNKESIHLIMPKRT